MNKFLFFIDHKWLLLGAVAVSLMGPSDGYAQTKTDVRGEVINVNPKLEVAFVDIREGDIRPGDVVEIQVAYEETVYLQVLEVTGVLSKVGFGPVVEREFAVRERDFQKIKIGNPVVKINFYDPLQDMRGASAQRTYGESVSGALLKETEDAIEASQDDARSYVMTRNEEYPADQAQCAQRVKDLERKLGILAKKLRYMKELIEKDAFFRSP